MRTFIWQTSSVHPIGLQNSQDTDLDGAIVFRKDFGNPGYGPDQNCKKIEAEGATLSSLQTSMLTMEKSQSHRRQMQKWQMQR